MSMILSKAITNSWIHLPREIQWNMFLGNRDNLVAQGKFDTSLSYINNQGEKWGDTYIRDVGLHYDDYSNWESMQRLYAIPKSTVYVNAPYEMRNFKDAAGGVTGLIGEVLTVIFLQKVMNIPPYHVAHIKLTSTIKSPDLLVQININNLIKLISSEDLLQSSLLKQLNAYSLTNPVPLECKSRRYGATRLREALIQLIDYWKAVNDSAGCGMVSLVNLYPQTSIDILLFLPQHGKQIDIVNIINTTINRDEKSVAAINLTEKSFFNKLRGCFFE